MGRLFWKFFLSILLAQIAATVGIGGAIWLKNRAAEQVRRLDIDMSPPAAMAIESAAATLEFGGAQALTRLLENMERHRVFAVDDKGKELLGRIVNKTAVAEARKMLDKGDTRVVRRVSLPDGRHYLLFLPAQERNRERSLADATDARPLLAGAGMPLGAGGPRREGWPQGGQPGGPPGHGPPGEQPGRPQNGRQPGSAGGGVPPGQPYPNQPPPGQAGRDQPPYQARNQIQSPAQAGQPPFGGAAGGANMPGNPGGPMGPDGGNPRFQPLTPFIPLAAALAASLLFAALLAWYFSRPIRSLRQAFEAASGGDLAPRFAHTGQRGGDELTALGRDFDRMTARLRSLMDGQTRLLHDVSHELRSPLARLQAAIGLAHQRPDRIGTSLERIERESMRMDKLVGELLTLSRLEAGALSCAKEEIDMAELLQQIVGDAQFEASSQGRTVVENGIADVVLLGQPDLLARAVENVVRNAIKHSPEGGTVAVQSGPQSGLLRIRVLDRGPGVAPQDLQAIFEPFFRSSGTEKDVEGHGLGLAIARQVVQQHGGTITAGNREGGGLCVEIALPMD